MRVALIGIGSLGLLLSSGCSENKEGESANTKGESASLEGLDPDGEREVFGESATKSTPKAATMVAPVGKSQVQDAHSPATLANSAIAQPETSRGHSEPENMLVITAGTSRKENTSRMPATWTATVIAIPNSR